jgi:hypothetical protein
MVNRFLVQSPGSRPLERPIKVAILTAACLVFAGVSTLYIIKYATFKIQVQPALQRHNETISTWLTDFEADRIAAADSILSMPVMTDADAGADLNRKVAWKNNPEKGITIPELQLSSGLMDRLAAADWTAPDHTLVDGLDFSWMTASLTSSRWSFWAAEPVNHFFRPDHTVMSPPPHPDYDQLVAWAKLRYLHGLLNNDLLAAQSENRHLARLIETNEHPAATQAAMAIIALEQQVAAAPQATAAEFEPFPADLLHRIAAMLAFFESAAHPATRDDLVRKIVAFKEPHFGLCGVLAGYAFVRAVEVYRPIQFRDTTKILDKFAQTSQCRREYETHLAVRIKPGQKLAAHPFLKTMASKEFSYLLFKDTIGLIVDLSSVTDAGRFYRDGKKNAG